MEQRISFVTLGVGNLPRAKEFYSRMGWKSHTSSKESVVFYQAGQMVFALFPADHLAEDATVDKEGSGFRRFALAHNVRAKEDVQKTLQEAQAAGGKIVKPAQDVFWGGHSGFFEDTEGHLWEVAFNPFIEIGADGAMTL